MTNFRCDSARSRGPSKSRVSQIPPPDKPAARQYNSSDLLCSDLLNTADVGECYNPRVRNTSGRGGSSSLESKPERKVSFLWLEITNRCNLECLHCYADASPRGDLLGRMELNDWLLVPHEAAGYGCDEVQFIGGEPTLHPGIEKMVETASECGYRVIEVFTNATVLGKRLLSKFVDN
jgi:uncharacterized radical SAM superfamily Fe-S cluster-containing enzyme